ncbi:hypothetical protein ABBQ32_001892 [Trebouxia sp. C0010 RCD-2024]
MQQDTATQAALQVKCGSCTQVINVPGHILPQLAEKQQFRCPYCHNIQNVNLAPEVALQIMSKQRQDSWQKQSAEGAKQKQQQAEWSHANSLAHQDTAALNRLAAGAASQQYGQYPSNVVQTGSPDELGPLYPSSLSGWGQVMLQQQKHETDISRHRATQRDTDRQMLADVWRQSLYDDEGGLRDLANGYGAGLPGAQGLPAMPQPEEEEAEEEHEAGETFMDYVPSKLHIGAAHPDPVVETASLAAVEPPDITYQLHLEDLIQAKLLSGLQLESIVYACQRHHQLLPDGTRAGMFIGDGAGVGKGRTIAGLVVENWRVGRHKHMWVSIGSDLRIDTRRDLDDVGAHHIPVHPLNKLPYGTLASKKVGIDQGVIFLTYTSLTSSSDRGDTRLRQLINWAGPTFDGLIIFDECHKAKNLVPEAGSKSTKVGQAVMGLQKALPQARVVYCSATGASEPRNLGYMDRLGLWGPGTPSFSNFQSFLEAVGGRGMGALELVAMDMKARGMYVCRTLSFSGAEFEVVEAPLETEMSEQYEAAAGMWNQLRREFLYAAEQAEDAERDAGLPKKRGSLLWRSFWASHQRFFRHMCMAAKIPCLVRMSRAALEEGKCVVIGLQSTGEARTADVVAERGEILDDYVSGPRELLLRLVEDHYPLPSNPSREDSAPSSTHPHPPSANGLPSRADGTAAGRVDRKRKSSSRGAVEVSPKSRRTKRSIKASKGFGEGQQGKSEQEDEAYGDGMADDTHVHVTQALKGSLSDVKPEQDPHATPPHRFTPTSDEDALTPPYPPPEDGLDSIQLEDELSSPGLQGMQGVKAEHDQQIIIHDLDDLDDEEEDNDDEPMITKVESRQEREQAKADKAQLELSRLQKQQLQAKFDHANHRKAQVKKAIAVLGLPANPLDCLIDQLGGPQHVAEMTGRKARLVRQQGEGLTGVKWEARNASGVAASATLDLINVHERQMFLNLEKRIAIISEAASAGISLHADRRAKNQQRRVHLTLELPWSADKAIQQFGRSHRANQAHPPQYRLLFTPMGGERRFAAAVARRLESLGALTQGDRKAGPSLTAFNYESRWGQLALKATYKGIMQEEPLPVRPPCCCPSPTGEPPLLSLQHFLGQARAHLLNVGIIRPREDVTAIDINAFLSRPEGAPASVGRIADADKVDIARFLNRLLGLAPEAQAQIFDLYQAVLEGSIRQARKEGKYDEGIVDVKGTAITLAQPPQVIRRDERTGAPTLLFRVHVDRGISWDMAQGFLEQALAPAAAPVTEIETKGQALASPSQGSGDQGRSKQKLKIRLSGKLITTDHGRSSGRTGKTPQHPPPQLPCPAGIPDSTPSTSSPTPGSPTLHESAGDLQQQLQDMERQSRLDSLDMAAGHATATPHADTHCNMHIHALDPEQLPGVDATPVGVMPSASDPLNQSQQSPTFHHFGSLDGSGLEGGPPPSSLGSGLALGTVVADVPKAEPSSSPAAGDAPGPPSTSGYYRPERGAVRGVLLALETQGKGLVAVYRPATGPAARPIRLTDLQDRYVKLAAAEAEVLWQHQYEAAAQKSEKGVGGKGGWRVRELVLIGGLVLPIWGLVEQALVKQQRPIDRRMHVLRLQTTGDNARRLVGMLLPRGAVEDLLQELGAQQAAAEAQHALQAHQMHLSQLGSYHGLHLHGCFIHPENHILSGADDIQQLND